jgi:hypothetical protein
MSLDNVPTFALMASMQKKARRQPRKRAPATAATRHAGYYTLTRESDGAGDGGSMCVGLWVGDDGELKHEDNARPRVGIALRVGASYARTMSWQDWWQTSYITEILSNEPGKVVFTTENSVYTWTCG